MLITSLLSHIFDFKSGACYKIVPTCASNHVAPVILAHSLEAMEIDMVGVTIRNYLKHVHDLKFNLGIGYMNNVIQYPKRVQG